MNQPQPSTHGDERSLPELVSELWALVKEYLRQEAVDPIKGVGRYVGYGVAGALLLGIGAVLLAVGGLRVLQDETGSAFTGTLSWVPYLLTFVALLGGAGICLAAIPGRGRSRSGGAA